MEEENLTGTPLDLAKRIFTAEPQEPGSIHITIDGYECIEDFFNILLEVFIYGFKLRNITVQNINTLKPYFQSLSPPVNFVVDIIEWSELEFLTNKKYLNRYCSISPSSFEDSDLTNFQVNLSRNYNSPDEIDQIYACYNHEIKNNFRDSFICFLSFNFK
jgi:hypothetical protein